MFAINFLAVHVYMVYSRASLGVMTYIWGLDVILPFMIFAGYFITHGFKKQQKRSQELGITPGYQAWTYLKSRFLSLLPVFLVAQLMGFLVVHLFILRNPVYEWPIIFINHIAEFVGLQITGIGFGNAYTGVWGAFPPVIQLLNSPLWFISGIFVVGYIVYYLLAKCENLYLYFIGPIFGIIFYASQWLQDSNPLWFDIRHIGNFAFGEGFPHMFVGLTLGCIIWVAVDKLKDKDWSKGMRVVMTIVSFICSAIILYITWVPLNIPFWGELIRINWGSVHILTIFFSFFVLLGMDGFNWLLNWKIWAVPGRLAFYIYMLHFPIIMIIGGAMGVEDLGGLHRLMIVSTVVTIAISYPFMQLNNKVIQPWFKKQPWYSKKQRELEKENTAS